MKGKRIIQNACSVVTVIGLIQLLRNAIREKSKIDADYTKIQYYYNLNNRWMERLLKGRTVEKYLYDKGFRSVAIYGWGELGKRVCEDIENMERIKIKWVVDKNAVGKENCKYNIVSNVNQIKNTPDLMIVTPFLEFQTIKNDIKKTKKGLEILSLEDIIYEL